MAGLLALVCVLVCPASRADGAGDLTITNLIAISGEAGSSITVFGDLTSTSLSQLDFNNHTPTFYAEVFTGSGDLTLNGILGFGPAVIPGNTTLHKADLFIRLLRLGSMTSTTTLCSAVPTLAAATAIPIHN